MFHWIKQLPKSIRIVALPAPGIDTHGIHVSRGAPVEQFGRKSGIGVAGGNITGAARRQLVRNRATAGLFKGLDDIEHAVAGPGAEVHRKALRLVQAGQRLEMPERQIDNVNVVAHAGAIRRRVIVAPDLQLLAPADGDLGDEGHQVVRDALRVFADQAAFVRADRVEVAQDADPPGGVGAVEVAQHVFDDQLGPAVGVGCRERVIFGQRQALWVAVDGGGGTEDEGLDTAFAHGAEQAMRADDVVVVVFERFFDGFADRFEPGKMDDRLAIKLAQGGSDGCLVADIALDAVNFFACDGLDALQRFPMTIGKIVEDDHFLTGLEKFDAGM